MVFHGRTPRFPRSRQAQGRTSRDRPSPFSTKKVAACAAVLAFLSACGSTPRQSEPRNARGHFAAILSDDSLDEVATTEEANLPEDVETIVELSDEAKAAIDEIEKEILAESDTIDAAQAEVGPRHKIPIEINRRVREWIYYFSIVDHERFQGFLNRGAYYRPVIESILARNDIPTDLYYLAMIESGFMAHARSRANAVGFWQFMRPTGREYGLKIGDGIDERRDILRSTEAGARYLKWLKNRLGSWHLAIAAYNGGPGRVGGAIRRGGSKDFWELARKRVLPPETRQYLPKFLAASLIGKNPGKYGFQIQAAGPLGGLFPAVETVFAGPGQPLSAIARARRVSASTLKALNPHLIVGRAPLARRPYPIWVPAQDEEGETPPIRLVRQAPPQHRSYRSSRSGRMLAMSRKIHIVRNGEGLLSISRKYGISVKALRAKNRLHSSRILRGQRLRIPPRSS